MNPSAGHRDRLRQRFRLDPKSLSETETLELLLTYAIPRRDVSTLASELLTKFGNLVAVLDASELELMQVNGIGESVSIFLQLLRNLVNDNIMTNTSQKSQTQNEQMSLFDLGLKQPNKPEKIKQSKTKSRAMRVFANDEIANTIELLPKVTQFAGLDDFKQYLIEKLPYNAADTRQRRANYIIERYFPEDNLDVSLTFFLGRYSALTDLKPIIFFHMLKAEPIAAKVAEELIWPSLPIGRVEREQLREFVMRYLPDAKIASQAKILQALYHTYDLTGIGTTSETTLHFQLHTGTLESLLYILTSVFPEPGMYSFEALYNSPVHRWLLWDREWIRQQLYNLQDYGVLSKISEIDTVRQFTLGVDQRSALGLFFEHSERKHFAIREQAEHQETGQEG